MLTEHGERFHVIPAVDVLGGEAVRLERGVFDRVVARDADPLALVERLVAAGARLIHVVDLSGSRSGRIRPELFSRLAAAASPAAIQAAGGVRSLSDAEQLIEAGATRVVIGTAAFAGRMALSRYAAALRDRLVVAIDARDGLVAVRGWEQTTGLTVEEAVARCAQAGVPRLLCTAIERDGTLSGPALDLLAQVRERSGLPVLAAGGIRSRTDLEAVATVGCEGAIVGRAVLEGLLPLPQPDRPARPTDEFSGRDWSLQQTIIREKEQLMFASTKAFSGFAVDDLPKAKEFYESTLGLSVSGGDGLLTLHLAGGRDTLVYPKPDFTPATYTILNFPVDDIEEAVDELAARGVRFLRYDGFDQDEKGIARAENGPDIAWFTDPAGNILAVLEER